MGKGANPFDATGDEEARERARLLVRQQKLVEHWQDIVSRYEELRAHPRLPGVHPPQIERELQNAREELARARAAVAHSLSDAGSSLARASSAEVEQRLRVGTWYGRQANARARTYGNPAWVAAIRREATRYAHGDLGMPRATPAPRSGRAANSERIPREQRDLMALSYWRQFGPGVAASRADKAEAGARIGRLAARVGWPERVPAQSSVAGAIPTAEELARFWSH